MSVVDIIIIIYCILLTVVMVAYVVSNKDKECKGSFSELGRNKIPVILGSKTYFIYADSSPIEIINIIGDPHSVTIDPFGTGIIEYHYKRDPFKTVKVEDLKFVFNGFGLVEIKRQ